MARFSFMFVAESSRWWVYRFSGRCRHELPMLRDPDYKVEVDGVFLSRDEVRPSTRRSITKPAFPRPSARA